LRHGLDDLNALDVDLVGGHIDVPLRDRPTAAELVDFCRYLDQKRALEEAGFGATANLFVHRDALARAGEFDDTLISSGDREWGQRAGDRGVRAVYADDAAVRHPARRSLSELMAKARRLQTGEAQLRRLRGESLGWRGVVRPFVRPPVRTIAGNLARVEPPTVRARAEYAGFTVLLFYFAAVQRARVARRDRR
jgi:hypothetical protein